MDRAEWAEGRVCREVGRVGGRRVAGGGVGGGWGGVGGGGGGAAGGMGENGATE